MGEKLSPKINISDSGSVIIKDGSVVLVDFEENDLDFVSFIKDSADTSQAVHQCLLIGVRSISAASSSLDSQLIEQRFAAMSETFDKVLDVAVGQISETAQELVDEENGALPAILELHQQRLNELLGSTFDPDSKKSVMAVFEMAMETAHQSQLRAVERLVATTGVDSPLAKLKNEIISDIQGQVKAVQVEINDLSVKLTVDEAVADVMKATSAKGFSFEEVVHENVSSIAALHGDVAESVGRQKGSAGNQIGDEVVVVNSEDTSGADGRFVLEVKATSVSMPKILKELDSAIENRAAIAAVAVFDTQENAPTSVPFHYSTNKAIVVLDAFEKDLTPLRLAYMWARWVVRRQLAAASSTELDFDRISSLLEEAHRTLKRQSAIKRGHSNAKKGIELAETEVGALTQEINDVLDRISKELTEERE